MASRKTPAEREWAKAEQAAQAVSSEWEQMQADAERSPAAEAERERTARAELEARATERKAGCKACIQNPDRPHGVWHELGPQDASGTVSPREYIRWAESMSRQYGRPVF